MLTSDRRLARILAAGFAAIGVLLGTTGVRAIVVIPLRARNSHHRPKQTYANSADSDIASAIFGISEVSEKPSNAGARTAWASTGRPFDR